MAMNAEQHLLLLKGVDRTEDVRYCQYVKGKYIVTFMDGKTYEYAYQNVQWLKNPQVLDPKNHIVYKGKLPLTGIQSIYIFGDWVKIRFVSGYAQTYPRYQLSLEKNSATDPKLRYVLDYFRKMAEIVSVKDEQEQSFLSKQYQRMTTLSPKSVLATYLKPESLTTSPNSTFYQSALPYFPFGFNLSQKEAAEKALSSQISVIEGPPGTGKTQTILNLIANAVMNGKTVAVVSNNNAATANVMDKLRKYELDFIAAFLGNTENRAKFLAGQTGEYPDMSSWSLHTSAVQELKSELRESGEKLQHMLSLRNQVATLNRKLDELTLEKRYFLGYYYKDYKEEIAELRSIRRLNSRRILSLWHEYQLMAENHSRTPWHSKLKFLLKYGITDFSLYQHSHEQVITYLQKNFYDLWEQELETQIARLNRQLEHYQFEESMKDYSEGSMRLFKAVLADKYGNLQQRRTFTDDVFWKDKAFDSFLQEYPVILSTTHSLRSCIRENYLFDYVIMDEASQIDVVSGALALSCAKQAVVVGDLQQLPNVVPHEMAMAAERIFNQFSIPRVYHYAEHSMLSSLLQLFEQLPRTILKEHYRCHPKIIEFCNRKFYQNQLVILTEEKSNEEPLVLYKLAKGNHARGHYNQREIDVILEEVIPQQRIQRRGDSVGIISPYRKQAEKLQEALKGSDIEVDTVHKFQGREKKTIILSTVVNEVNEFVDQPNLINVAVSRAVNKLIVIVSDNEQNENSNIGDLERYIRYQNFSIVPSQIYSVFDLLYREYSEKLVPYLKNLKRVSSHRSENLLYTVIQKVLERPEFSNLGVVLHQPLRMLIRNTDGLSEAERRFVQNILTHTDFLIFHKMDKRPVLVVEVDGYSFHANNPRQLERDRMKDAILAKYNIPILRLATNESREEKRLIQRLREVVGH